MKIMYIEDEIIEIETCQDGDSHMKVVMFLDDATMTLQIPNSDYDKMIEDGIIDTMDDEFDFEEDYCECPYCKIGEQIETLNVYLEESLSECDFEEIKNITESIKNLMMIREML